LRVFLCAPARTIVFQKRNNPKIREGPLRVRENDFPETYLNSVHQFVVGDASVRRLFAVTRSRGEGWNNSLPMEEQEDWQSHAAFMNALQNEGFVLLGGPLEGTLDVLLIIRANDAEEIRSRLSGDPWSHTDLLRITRVVHWTLRLGTLG